MINTFIQTFWQIQDFLFKFGTCCLAVLWVLIPILYITICRKFDKLFKKKFDSLIIYPYIIILNEVVRSIIYSLCIVFYKRIKNPKARVSFDYNTFFDNYDFRGNANKFQIVLSTIFWVVGISACTLGLISCIPLWIAGGIDWVETYWQG